MENNITTNNKRSSFARDFYNQAEYENENEYFLQDFED